MADSPKHELKLTKYHRRLIILFCLVFLGLEILSLAVHSAANQSLVAQEAGKKFLDSRKETIAALYEASDTYVYELKPNDRSVVDLKNSLNQHLVINNFTNENRFAQRETVSKAKSPNCFRIITQGDSTTQGQDVDIRCYPTELRRILKTLDSKEQRFEVINAGVTAWFLDQIALRAEKQLADYCPDLVVVHGLADFACDDPFSKEPPKTSFMDREFRSNLYPTGKGPLLDAFLSAKSALAGLANTSETATETVGKYKLIPAEKLYKHCKSDLSRLAEAYRRRNPGVKLCYCLPAAAWPQMSAKEFEIVQIPPGSTAWMQQHKVSQAEAAQFVQRYRAVMSKFARSLGFHVFDISKDMELENRRALMADYVHYNEAGYRLLAEFIYEHLRTEGLVKVPPRSELQKLRSQYLFTESH